MSEKASLVFKSLRGIACERFAIPRSAIQSAVKHMSKPLSVTLILGVVAFSMTTWLYLAAHAALSGHRPSAIISTLIPAACFLWLVRLIWARDEKAYPLAIASTLILPLWYFWKNYDKHFYELSVIETIAAYPAFIGILFAPFSIPTFAAARCEDLLQKHRS